MYALLIQPYYPLKLSLTSSGLSHQDRPVSSYTQEVAANVTFNPLTKAREQRPSEPIQSGSWRTCGCLSPTEQLLSCLSEFPPPDTTSEMWRHEPRDSRLTALFEADDPPVSVRKVVSRSKVTQNVHAIGRTKFQNVRTIRFLFRFWKWRNK